MNLFPPSKQNTFVVIVTYNPDNRLCISINAIKKIFESIVIIDNNSVIDVKLLVNDNNIHFIRNINNLGIAKALNIGAEYAISKGALWLLMLDQDTIPRSDILEIFTSLYVLYPNQVQIGQMGVSFPNLYTKKSPYKNVNVLITSGTLLSLTAFKEAGNFREDFFIDSVDFEYSLRLKKKGYVNLQSPETAIDHRLGNIKEKKYLGLSIKSSNHPPQRRYYMARNHLIISLQYFLSFPFWVLKKNYFFLLSIIEIILIDDQKLTKIKKTFLGIRDGLFYRTPRNL